MTDSAGIWYNCDSDNNAIKVYIYLKKIFWQNENYTLDTFFLWNKIVRARDVAIIQHNNTYNKTSTIVKYTSWTMLL